MAHDERLAISAVSTTTGDHIHERSSLSSLLSQRSSPRPFISASAATTMEETTTAAYLQEHSPCSSPKPYVSSPWDVETYSSTAPYRCLASILKRCGKILALAVSDTSLVYVGSESKSIRVWKLPGFIEFGHLKSSSGAVKAILVSEDGLVFSAHSDNKIRVWESSPVHTRKGTLPCFKDCLVQSYFNRPKKFLMRSTSKFGPSTINSYNNNNNKIKHSSEITGLAYNPLGKLLYSASLDKTVKVWSISDMKCIETIRAHDDHVNALVVGPDGLLFSGSDDTTVRIWRKSLRGDCYHGLILNLHVQHSPVKALALSGEVEERDESYILYAGCSDGYVHYWKKGELSGHMNYCGYLRGHSHAVMCLAAVDNMVISGSADTSIRVWRRSSDGLALHRCMAVLSGHIAPVKGVAAKVEDDHGCLVYSGSLDGSVKLWWVWRGSFQSSRGNLAGDQETTSTWTDYFEISGPVG